MQNKPKILMAVGNDIAFDARVQRSLEALKEDFDITLVCYSSSYSYKIPDVDIIRIKVPNFKEYRGIKKILSLFWHLYFFLLIIINVFKIKPDIFYGHDFFMALPGYLIATLCKVFFIYDAHELIISDRIFKQPLELKFWYYLEKMAVKRANIVICANEERAKLMQKHYKLSKQPEYIRNISPVTIKSEGLPEEYEKILDKKHGEFRVIYQGVIDLNRNLLPFVNAFRSIEREFRLFFIGYGNDFNKLKSYIDSNNLTDKVILLSKVPRELLHFIISKFDAGIVAYSNLSLNEIYCEPNKLYDYTQLGLPVICTCQHNLVKIIEKYKIGEVVGCGQEDSDFSDEVKNALLKIKNNISFYQDNIKVFIKEYNWDNEKKRMIKIVKKSFFQR